MQHKPITVSTLLSVFLGILIMIVWLNIGFMLMIKELKPFPSLKKALKCCSNGIYLKAIFITLWLLVT